MRRELGYPGPVPMRQPALPDEADAYLEDGILDVVIARGRGRSIGFELSGDAARVLGPLVSTEEALEFA